MVDLKSTDSGAAMGRHEDTAVAVDRSFPLVTVLDAGAVPVVPSAEAPVCGASDVKLAELGPPYFGRLDLAAEDKIRAFDQFSAMVSSVLAFFFIGSTAVLPMGVAPEAVSKRVWLLTVLFSLLSLLLFRSLSFNTVNVWFLMLNNGGGPMTLPRMLLLLWMVRLSAAFI